MKWFRVEGDGFDDTSSRREYLLFHIIHSILQEGLVSRKI